MGYFKGKQFKKGIILVAVGYYCRFYLINSDNDKVGGDGFLGGTMAVAFEFTLFNGILLGIVGFYLLLKGTRKLGWATIAIVLIFYLIVMLIHFYDRPGAA